MEQRVRGAGPRPRRPPEIVQTSTLDCGPASLTSLLRGLGIPASYEELRDVCATDVDGTSINSLEAVAKAVGVDCSQMMVPVEHVLALPTEYLPCIAVTTLPDGFTHFVVLWRRVRDRVLMMDPAEGRRWVPVDDLVHELYHHEKAVSATGWRDWAGKDVFADALRVRLGTLGVDDATAATVIARAQADPGPMGLSVLDAAIRHLADTGTRGAEALDLAIAERRARWGPDVGPEFSCKPIAADETRLRLRATVLIRAKGVHAEAPDAGLRERLAQMDPSPGRVLRDTLARPGWTAAAVLAGAATMAGLGVAEEVALRPLVEVDSDASNGEQARAVVVAAAAAFGGLVAGAVSLRAGRSVDLAVRRRWWDVVPGLPDAFTRTRPVSDLAERGHLMHRLRELPVGALRAGYGAGIVFGGAVVMAVVAPPVWPWIVLLLIVALGGPLLMARRAAEADLRVRTLSGSLTRYSTDAIRGAEMLRAAGPVAAAALRHEHDRSLAAWVNAQRRLVLISALTRGTVGGLAALATVGAVVTVDAGVGTVLLLAVMGSLIVDGGGMVADALRTLPVTRSTVARATGALRAGRVPPPSRLLLRPPTLELDKVTVATGGVVQLDELDAVIPAGSHVAVLGASGAGKSTLLSVLLGWAEVTSGQVYMDGRPYDPVAVRAVAAWMAPETRLWNDPVTPNVTYGSVPGAPDAVKLLELVEADELARRIDARPDVRLGEDGGALSDGEGSRIRLARALGRPDAPLVFLDEPFRGLERTRRQRLLTAVREHWCHSTLLMTCHQISDTRGMDLVLILGAGRVIEFGTPATLAANPDSVYSGLLVTDRWEVPDSWDVHDLGSSAADVGAGPPPEAEA